jgi:hypothetical protein
MIGRGDNKKGRGEIAPTFLIVASLPMPVHPWSKPDRDEALRAANSFSAHQQCR